MKKKHLSMIALAIPFAALLSGCSITDSLTDKLDESVSKSAKTSAEGVESGLLPGWVPEGGTDVELEQRSTGNERLFTMVYTGELPKDQCTPIATTGKPSKDELAASYAKDNRTKNSDVEDFATVPTLSADWWADGSEKKTTDLCGRWWVHQEDGKLYAFAPDTQSQVDGILQERKVAESKS